MATATETIQALREHRDEVLRDLDAIPSRLVGSEKWNDRIGELCWIKRRLAALGAD